MHTTHKKPNLSTVLTILVLASSASIMSTDLYAPSLPHLPEYFDTSAPAVKLTLTLNLLAFGLSQLVLGPLSDRFGRRPVLLAGLLAFSASSFACATAQSIEMLILARVLQGMAASVEAVVGLAILHDLFDETQRVRALAIWGMSIAMTPAAAPILGGYIHVALGWQANFVLTGLVGFAVVVAAWRWLPESTRPRRGALRPGPLYRAYMGLLSSRKFTGHALMLGVGMGMIYAFVTAAPFILIDGYAVATEHFGYYQAVIVVAYFIGSWAANRLAGRITLDLMFETGLAVSAVGALSLPLLLATGHFNPFTFIAGMSFTTLGLGPIFAVSPSRALEQAGDHAGTASALVGGIELTVGSLAAAAVTVFHDDTPRPLVGTMIVLLVVGAFAWRRTRTKRETRDT